MYQRVGNDRSSYGKLLIALISMHMSKQLTAKHTNKASQRLQHKRNKHNANHSDGNTTKHNPPCATLVVFGSLLLQV